MIVVESRATQETFQSLNLQFLGLENIKKGHMEMTEKIYLETLKSVLGQSTFHYYKQSAQLNNLKSAI